MNTETSNSQAQESLSTGKATLVLGASLKADRYSNRAIRMLREHGHPVLALGLREGRVGDVDLEKDPAVFVGSDVHTVTLYLNAERQQDWHGYILDLQPKRIVFNPGAENRVLKGLAEANGIECLEACTLVMLTLGQY